MSTPGFSLLEVPVVQTLEGNTVASFVAHRFVGGSDAVLPDPI